MKKQYFCNIKLTIFLLIANISFATYVYAEEENYINLVSARQEYLIKPILEEFTKDTGIKVNYTISFGNIMVNMIKLEGEDSEVDAYIANDAGDLYNLQQNGILQPIRSEVLERNIPSHLRDPSKQWYGISMRVRSVIYNTNVVNPSLLKDYESLGDAGWKNKLALRTSKKVYNKSMVAMMIAHYGYEKTKIIVSSWVKNLNTKPLSDDIKVINEILENKAEIGIVNSYYLAKMLRDNPSLPIKMAFVGDENKRVHINISGIGVTRYAKRKKNAIKLIEWLSSKKGQKLFANINMEYPVNKRVKAHKILQDWGKFRQMKINVKKAGELRREAVKLMKEVAYE
jgi:iron(III) transport system substrate-binding protein